ncbi:MAG: hypothetical protein WCP52_11130 [Bacteroidota bacterium]
MKSKLLLLFSSFLLLILVCSFTGDTAYLLGKWNITAIGTADQTLVKQMNTNKDTIQGSLTELSNMMKEGYVYEFRSGGLFKVTDKAKKEIVLGDYTLTKDGELLTLINGGVDVEYKLIKTSEKHIKLISKKDASTMELSKN